MPSVQTKLSYAFSVVIELIIIVKLVASNVDFFRKLKLEDAYQLQKFLSDAKEHVCQRYKKKQYFSILLWNWHIYFALLTCLLI